MYNVIITDKANNMLNKIATELSSYSKSKAGRIFDKLEVIYDNMKDNPRMYEKCNDTKLCDLGYRRVVVENFIVIYKISDKARLVYILGFYYGKSEYEKFI